MKTILKLMLLQLTLAGGVMAWQKFPHLSGNYGLATIRNIGWGGPSQPMLVSAFTPATWNASASRKIRFAMERTRPILLQRYTDWI
jgi:hypothetical protein